MKILQVNDFCTYYGGVEQYLFSVTALLHEHGHQNVVLHQRDGQVRMDSIERAYHVPDDELAAEKVSRLIQSEKPDVAYIHQMTSPRIVSLVTSQIPSVVYVHNFRAVCPGHGKYFRKEQVVCERPFTWACFPVHYLRRCSAARDPRTTYRLMAEASALRDAYQSAPMFLVASAFMKQLLVQNKFEESRISILPPHYLPAAPELPAFAPEEPPIVLYAGRLEEEKGVAYLLEAFSTVPQSARLLLVGDGTMRARYEQLVATLDLNDRVDFIGWQNPDQMVELYRRSALVVVPSIWPEPFGKVGIEALSQARPVVAFDVGGVSSWLTHGVNGYLVEPRNTEGLAKAITLLLENELKRREMGEVGQQIVFRQFSAATHLDRLETALRLAAQGTSE